MACGSDAAQVFCGFWFETDRYGREGWFWRWKTLTLEQVLRVEERHLRREIRTIERRQTQLERDIKAKRKNVKAADTEGNAVVVRRLLQDVARDTRSTRTLSRQKDQAASTITAIANARSGLVTTMGAQVLTRVLLARAAQASPRQLARALEKYSRLTAEQRVAEDDFAECFNEEADDLESASAATESDSLYALAVELDLTAPSQYCNASAIPVEMSVDPSMVRDAAQAAQDVYDANDAHDADADALFASYGATSSSSSSSSSSALRTQKNIARKSSRDMSSDDDDEEEKERKQAQRTYVANEQQRRRREQRDSNEQQGADDIETKLHDRMRALRLKDDVK